MSFWFLNHKKLILGVTAAIVFGVIGSSFVPLLAHANVESSLASIQQKITGVILPLLSVIGIALAGFSFFSGNPQAKTHITYAIIGTIIGFGAQAIVDLIRSSVR